MSKAIDLENGLPAIKSWANGKFVEKVNGQGLSTNDYTTAEKNKLSGIATGAKVNVQADWNETNTSSDSYIKNKPTIPDITGIYKYRGSVATYANLPSSPATGDVYNVEAAYGDYPAGTNWAWDGTAWDALGGSFTITYATAAEVTAVLEG